MTERILTDVNGRKYINREPLLHPPQREWQGLTERDVKTITENAPSVEWAVLMTESTLKEKNT